ncbi:MAG: hypothetical protein ABSA15_00240 [Thermoplasmata archaeon]|jgi:hypothetical protein
MSGATEPGSDDTYHPNVGWIASGLIVAAIFAVGAAFWFMYHPL